MLASLERVRSLVSRPVHAYRQSVETFADLDVQLLASQLKLNERGVTGGRQNSPPSNSTALDAVETEIIEHVGAAQKTAHNQLENHLAGFRQRLIDLDFEGRFANIKRAAASGLSDLEAELGKGVDDLHEARRDLTQHEEWMREFKKQHGIKRPAKITSTRGTVFKWSLIVLIVLIELLVNGELLSKNNDLGIAGGVFEAILFAVLNVGVALLFALYAVPYLSHRSFFAKILGFASLLAYLAAMLGINLGLAHYREVSGSI